MASDRATFTYHPNCYTDGVTFVQTNELCEVCGKMGGLADRNGACPACIASGKAAKQFDQLNYATWSTGPHDWRNVPMAVQEEVEHRTPGLVSDQDTEWWACCGDAAEFVGYGYTEEMSGKWRDAWAYIERHQDSLDDDGLTVIRDNLAPDGAKAYVFRCRTCGKMAACWDCD